MTDLEARVAQLEENVKNIALARIDGDNINSNDNERIEKRALSINAQTNANLEDTAITMADFMAEYYLSQFEGGEEE